MPARTRNTAQRQAISKRLEELSVFVSAQRLHEELARGGTKIGLATVYRTLQTLASDGTVDTLRTDSEILYRYCGTDSHHHHLVALREDGRSGRQPDRGLGQPDRLRGGLRRRRAHRRADGHVRLLRGEPFLNRMRVA